MKTKEQEIEEVVIALGRVNDAIFDLEDQLNVLQKKRQELFRELLVLEGKIDVTNE